MIGDIGPFDGKTQKPVRAGVYHTSLLPTSGGGYGFWDGRQWQPFGNWGGDYWRHNWQWYWFGVNPGNANNPKYRVRDRG